MPVKLQDEGKIDKSYEGYFNNANTDTPSVDELEDIYNEPSADADQENENITKAQKKLSKDDPTKSIRDKETSPNPLNSPWANNWNPVAAASKKPVNNMQRLLKRGGPAGGVVGGLLALVLGMGSLGPVMLPFHIKAMLTNDGSVMTRGLNKIARNKMLPYKMGGVDTKGLCDSAVTIRCKFATVNEEFVKNLTKDGFTVETVKKGDNHILKSITLPDNIKAENRTISSPKELQNALTDRKNLELSSRLTKSMAANRADFFNRGSIFSAALSKLGISKAPRVKGGTPKEQIESIDKAVGAIDEEGKPLSSVDEKGKPISNPEAKSDARMVETEKIVKTKVPVDKEGKGGGAGGAIAGTAADAGCRLISAANKIRTSIKMARMAATAAFFMTFMAAVDQTMAGDGQDTIMSTINNQLTAVDTRERVQDPYDDDNKYITNPHKGLSPTDAQGYHIAAEEGVGGMPDVSLAKFAITGGAFGMLLDRTVGALIDKIPGKMTTIKTACAILANKLVAAAGAVQCVGAFLLLIPSLGATGGDAAMCAAMVAVGFALDAVFEKATGYFIARYGAVLIGATTVGPDVLNALFVGANVVLGSAAMEGGFSPTNQAGVKNYLAATEDTYQQDIAMQKYEATKNPFDATNQYTAVGAVATKLPIFAINTKTFMGTLATGLSAFGQAGFGAFTGQKAFAEYYTGDHPFNPTRYDHIKDFGLQEIGAATDATGLPALAMNDGQLSAEIQQSLDYMIYNGYVDDNSGKDQPTDTEQGKEYQKYLDHCARRKIPFGEDERSFEEQGIKGSEDDKWYTGAKCMENSQQINMFSAFHSHFGIDNTLRNEGEATGNNAVAPPSGTLADGDIKDLARQVAENPNISWVNQNTKNDLLEIAKGNTVTSNAGVPYQPNKLLLQVLISMASRYKFLVNNIGFNNDRFSEGANMPHPSGVAVDINSITAVNSSDASLNGQTVGNGFINFSSSQMPMMYAFTTDWMNASTSGDPKRGRVGQFGCPGRSGGRGPYDSSVSGFNMFTKMQPAWQSSSGTFAPGLFHFEDACNHLHIDVGLHAL